MRQFILRTDGNAKQLWAFLRNNWVAMAQSGKPLAVTVEEAKSKRTSAQNRTLHRLMKLLADNAWIDGAKYSEKAWKEQVKRQFIGTEEIELPDGKIVERALSTADLDVQEFSNLIDQIHHWSNTELGVDLESL